jgi:hypothetical protein
VRFTGVNAIPLVSVLIFYQSRDEPLESRWKKEKTKVFFRWCGDSNPGPPSRQPVQHPRP